MCRPNLENSFVNFKLILKYCRYIRVAYIFANFERRTNARIQEYLENYYYNSAIKEKFKFPNSVKKFKIKNSRKLKHAKITRSPVMHLCNNILSLWYHKHSDLNDLSIDISCLVIPCCWLMSYWGYHWFISNKHNLRIFLYIFFKTTTLFVTDVFKTYCQYITWQIYF